MSKILVADDNQDMLDTLSRIFALYEFDVITVLNGKDAITKACEEHPDLIILDGMMPEMDGFDTCKILKADPKTRDIPVVFLTANYIELHHRLKGLELGADDYLLKPFNSRELVVRIKSILKRSELTRRLRTENNVLVEHNQNIEKRLNKIQDDAPGARHLIVDPETGLYTYAFFLEHLKNELDRLKRYDHRLSVALISLQKKDKLQDLLGVHLFNFLVIKIANFIFKKMRAADILAFKKDEGYYLLLPETEREGAEKKISLIRRAIEEQQYLDEDMINSLQVSRKKIADLSKIGFFCHLIALTHDSSEIPDAGVLLERLKSDSHCLEKNQEINHKG
ncbi:MAG TPA: response regulator [Caldithrix abyssi]|uniref:Response regulator n=1 Tax=Caldithrix abyssi TaxID=187145 RepID=A0A7V1LLR2_CALAY|nr:response regulator [Caldithrix abyssi]